MGIGHYLSTSPPVSPFPLKERGKLIKKRGFAPLKHPLINNLHGMALEADNRRLGALTLSKQGFNIAVLVEMGNPC
jgi:hypothetical protein